VGHPAKATARWSRKASFRFDKGHSLLLLSVAILRISGELLPFKAIHLLMTGRKPVNIILPNSNSPVQRPVALSLGRITEKVTSIFGSETLSFVAAHRLPPVVQVFLV
jgi:hypothetical protein